MFFALTLSSLGSIAVFLPRFLERPFYLTLFLKSQNYLFVFFFIQFPMTFLSSGNLPLVGSSGVEPPTSGFSGVRANHLSYAPISSGGDEEDRTPDPLRARQVLSQLSYTPI